MRLQQFFYITFINFFKDNILGKFCNFFICSIEFYKLPEMRYCGKFLTLVVDNGVFPPTTSFCLPLPL